MHTTFNNIPFPRTTEEVNWDFYFASGNLTNLVSDTARPDIILTVNNVISSWEPEAICHSGQRECSWSFPRFIKLEMKMIFLALIVQCCINFAPGQAFVITRAGHGRDAFRIPTSIYKHNGAQSGRDCKSFYAVDRASDCSCMCPAKNATFAYHERRWSCVENRKLRRHLYRGKRILFIEKVHIMWLSMIIKRRNKTLSSKKGLFNLDIYFILGYHDNCRALFQKCKFLEPHGFRFRPKLECTKNFDICKNAISREA